MFWILKPEAVGGGDPGQDLSGSLAKLGPLILKAPGTYKVGRKGSDINFHDKAISRHHADIVVGPLGTVPEATASGPTFSRSKVVADWIAMRPSIKLKDVSKYGTRISDRSGLEKRFDSTDKSAELDEGDSIAFGHDKVHFRVECRVIIVCVSSTVESERRRHLADTLKTAGAGLVDRWSEFATHLVVDDNTCCNHEIIAAVSARCQLVQSRWVEALSSRKTLLDLLPREEEYLPSLLLPFVSDNAELSLGEEMQPTRIQLARRESIQRALEGWLFVIGAKQQYMNGFCQLVTAAGGTIRSLEELLGSEKAPRENRLLLVKPHSDTSIDGMMISSANLAFARSLPSTSQDKVLAAVLLGKSADLQLKVAGPAAQSYPAMANVEAKSAVSNELARKSGKMDPRPGTEEEIKGHGRMEESQGRQSGKQGSKRLREQATESLPQSGTGSAGIDGQLFSQVIKSEPWTQGTVGSESQLTETGVKRRRVSLMEMLQKRQKTGTSTDLPTTSGTAARTVAPSTTTVAEMVQPREGNTPPPPSDPSVDVETKNRAPVTASQQQEDVHRRTITRLPGEGTVQAIRDEARFHSLTPEEELKRDDASAGETPPSLGAVTNTASHAARDQGVKTLSGWKVKVEPTPDAALPSPESKADVVFKSLVVMRDLPERVSSEVTNSFGQGVKVVNFKRFRKVQALLPPGNSFESLVSLAKEAYREVVHQPEAERFMRLEQRRREEERLADELFRADKLRRVKAAPRAPVPDDVQPTAAQRGKGSGTKQRATNR